MTSNRGINLCLLIIFLLTSEGLAQSKKYDTLAQRIIERMSDVIGNLESCRFRLQVVNDVNRYGIIPAPSTTIWSTTSLITTMGET